VLDDLLKPIPAENPAGEDLGWSHLFTEIEEARREDLDLPEGVWVRERKVADWNAVAKLCSAALASRSKDLRLAGSLTEALLHLQGYAGLKDGLDLLRALLERFGDTVYPVDEDGDDDDSEVRAAALKRIVQRLGGAVRLVPLTRSGLDCLTYMDRRRESSVERLVKEMSGLMQVCTEVHEDLQGLVTRFYGSLHQNRGLAELKARTCDVVRHDAQRLLQALDGTRSPEPTEETLRDIRDTPLPDYLQKQYELESCLSALEALETLCVKSLGSECPDFRGLRNALNDVRQTLTAMAADTARMLN
jgi:predicted component of type VI protein secretion system